ncbi:hypothetical protein [Streptomyces parvulus]
MGRKKQQVNDDAWGHAAGAIGGLVTVFAVLGAIKDKLGLSWPVTVVLVVAVLVGLGYGAWRLRSSLQRLLTGQTQPAATLKQEAAPAASLATARRTLRRFPRTRS